MACLFWAFVASGCLGGPHPIPPEAHDSDGPVFETPDDGAGAGGVAGHGGTGGIGHSGGSGGTGGELLSTGGLGGAGGFAGANSDPDAGADAGEQLGPPPDCGVPDASDDDAGAVLGQ